MRSINMILMMYRFCIDDIVRDGHVRVDVFIYFLLIMWGSISEEFENECECLDVGD